MKNEQTEHVMASDKDIKLIEPLKKPIRQYIDYLYASSKLVIACIRGLRDTTQMLGILNAINELDSSRGKTTVETISETQEAEHWANFAHKEAAAGYPLLFGHTITGVWGALEVSIDDFVAAWLNTDRSTLHEAQALKIKVSAHELLSMTKEERIHLIVSDMSRNVGSDYRLGVARFESILKQVGLGGATEDRIRRDILEMQQVRHVWAHLGGTVDKRFKEACPWTEHVIGDTLKIDQSRFSSYLMSTLDYAINVLNRALHNYNLYCKERSLDVYTYTKEST